MLVLNDIYKSFPKADGNPVQVLRGLDLTVETGEFVTVLGNNGAGKSTLFNIIGGALWPNRGKITLNDRDITFLPEHKRSHFIGRVFQNPQMGTAPNLTVAENLALAYGRQNRKLFNRAITKDLRRIFAEKLSEAGMGLEDKLDNRMNELSGGQSQVVALIMSTLRPPQLLLLDEHTAALDPQIAKDVLDFTCRLAERDKLTVIMITHNLQDAIDIGDRLIMLDKGKIAHIFAAEEKKTLVPDDLRKLYHIP
ncbi:ABC transporter ATP-binding protein [Peptococcus simiae]|uniref:ABC transporter ATP-binding protein n=1 Tax=Peptococcus simiae TaxID=1643805 RepID=UPI0039809A2D